MFYMIKLLISEDDEIALTDIVTNNIDSVSQYLAQTIMEKFKDIQCVENRVWEHDEKYVTIRVTRSLINNDSFILNDYCYYINELKLTYNTYIDKFDINKFTPMLSFYTRDKQIDIKFIDRLFEHGKLRIENPDFSKWNTSTVISMNSLFKDCSVLTYINLNTWDVSNVKCMDCVFDNCNRLETIVISNWSTNSVEEMRFMFENCYGLKTIVLPEHFGEHCARFGYMFFNCINLEEIDITKINFSNAVHLHYMFYNCRKLKLLETTAKHIDTSRSISLEFMFYNCEQLKTLDLSTFDTSKVINISGMFNGCSSLEELDISSFNLSLIKPDKNTMKPTLYLFKDCDNLHKIKCSKEVYEKIKSELSKQVIVEYV